MKQFGVLPAMNIPEKLEAWQIVECGKETSGAGIVLAVSVQFVLVCSIQTLPRRRGGRDCLKLKVESRLSALTLGTTLCTSCISCMVLWSLSPHGNQLVRDCRVWSQAVVQPLNSWTIYCRPSRLRTSLNTYGYDLFREVADRLSSGKGSSD